MNPILKTLTATTLTLGMAAPATAFADGKLTIWTGNNRDRDALLEAISGFTGDLGIVVEVEIVDPDLPQKYQQAAATGDGPDIVMWAHDRFGEWAGGGLIAPVSPSDDWAAGAIWLVAPAMALSMDLGAAEVGLLITLYGVGAALAYLPAGLWALTGADGGLETRTCRAS